MPPDHAFNRAGLLLALIPAAHQYCAEFQLLRRHIDARDRGSLLAARSANIASLSVAAKIGPVAARLGNLIAEYFSRFSAFQNAVCTAIDALAESQPFVVPFQELREQVHKNKRDQIMDTCRAVFRAAEELNRDPRWRQIPENAIPFVVAPLLTESEISGIEAEMAGSEKLIAEYAELALKQANESTAAKPTDTPSSGTGPRRQRTRNALRVDQFLNAVQERTGRKILRKGIWLVAGYRERTEFQKWQRDDPSCKAGPKFEYVLNMKPEDFVSKLDRTANEA